MANGDALATPDPSTVQPKVRVKGPDGKVYGFPAGTTKDKAVAYFKTKNIGAAPTQKPIQTASPTTEPSGSAAPQATPEHHAGYFTDLSKASTELQGQISKYRPRWDDPSKMLEHPSWATPLKMAGQYGFDYEMGGGKALVGGAVGGVKILSDLVASVDPRELYEPTGQAQEVGKDIKGVAYGIGQMASDLLFHLNDTVKDPEKLGSDVMNMAMTVDGGLKGAKAITEAVFPDAATIRDEAIAKTGQQTSNAQQAMIAAKKASEPDAVSRFRWNAVKSAYLHKNGVGVAKDILKADDEAAKEVKVHVDNLGKIPKTEGIDGYSLAKKIEDTHVALVKTPDPLNPRLNELLASASNVAPGKMTFEEARQFRSKIGAAIQNAKGTNVAELSKAYGQLTSDLKGLAKKYGLQDSWDQYNELEMKRHKSFPLLEKAKQVVGENGEGATMAQALKNEAATKETIKSLSKYGLDADKTTKYMNKSGKILRDMPLDNQRLTSFIYRLTPGTPFALGGMIAGSEVAKAAGMTGSPSYVAALGTGAAAGIAAIHIVNVIRAMKLHPEILDNITDSREWPGRLWPPEGDIPEGPSPDEGSPTGPQAPPTPSPKLPEPQKLVEGPTAQAASLPTPETTKIEEVAKPKPKATTVKGGKDISNKAKAAQVKAEAKVNEGGEVVKPRQKSNTPWYADPGSIPGEPSEYFGLPSDARTTESSGELWEHSTGFITVVDGPGADRYEAYRVVPGKDPELLRDPSTGLQQFKNAEDARQAVEKEGRVIDVGTTKITKVPEGQHGTGDLAKAAKKAEKVAAVRKVKGSTALGGGTQEISGGDAAGDILKKAEARTQAPPIDVSKMDVVDLERDLQRVDIKKFEEAQKLGKRYQLVGDEWRSVLEFHLTEAYEDVISKSEGKE